MLKILSIQKNIVNLDKVIIGNNSIKNIIPIELKYKEYNAQK